LFSVFPNRVRHRRKIHPQANETGGIALGGREAVGCAGRHVGRHADCTLDTEPQPPAPRIGAIDLAMLEFLYGAEAQLNLQRMAFTIARQCTARLEAGLLATARETSA